MKKLLCIFCAVLLMLTAFPASAALGAGDPTITVSSVDSCQRGDEITVTLSLSNNPGTASLIISPSVPAGLTYKKATNGDIFDDFSAAGGKNFQFYTELGDDTSENGTLVTVTFTVDADATPGEYTIGFTFREASNEDGADITYTVEPGTVTVVLPATGMTVDPKTATVKTGETTNISAVFTPDGASGEVTWTSSDTSIATVENGVVTGVKKGNVTITATSGSFSDTCEVTVECSHANTTNHPAVESTCLVQGNAAYVTCDDCGEVVEGSDEKLPLGDHTGGTATCQNKAVCDVCGQEYGELADHTMTEHPRVEATHSAPGNIQYWTCEVCGKFFSDAAGATEITEAETVIAQIPHAFSEDWSNDENGHWHVCECGVKADEAAHVFDNDCDPDCNVCGYTRQITHQYSEEWTTDGTNHWHECTVCGDKINVEPHTGGEATCQDKAVCSVCNQPYGELADHVYEENASEEFLKTPADCKNAAVYYKSCEVCGAKSDETFTYGDPDPENHVGPTEVRGKKDPTCTENGYTGDTYCTACGELVSEGLGIMATDHTTPDTWKSDADNHWKECSVCNEVIPDTTAAHTAGDWIVDKEAQVNVAGSRHKECTTCGYVMETEEIPALIEYHIIEGAGSTWKASLGTGQTFASDAEYAIFVEVLVDGKVVDPSNYTDSEGSTVIEFTKEYMSSLSVGTHKLIIRSEDGEASCDFIVATDANTGPNTGYAGRLLILIPLMMLGLAGIMYVLFKEKRRAIR